MNMNRSSIWGGFGASVLFALTGVAVTAQAQTLTNVTVTPPSPKPGDAVMIKVDLRAPAGPSWCGLLLDLGNSARRELRIGDNGSADLSQTVSIIYPNPGTYRITVSGSVVRRGLKSAPACDGAPLSQDVKILDPEVGALRKEAAVKDLDEREKALQEREKALQDKERAQIPSKAPATKKTAAP
jgi:hypothetical protein